ncbi:Long-chain specific acyl-CoA dehydrogenase [Trichinella pseudospiralis]
MSYEGPAYVFRFITNCKAVPEERKTTPLDVREIDQAEKFWSRSDAVLPTPEILKKNAKHFSLKMSDLPRER